MGIWDDFFSKAKSLFGNETEKKSTCYYELLGVSREATEDDIKRAYKKMALKWHPDKNPDRLEECTAFFVVLQQAYEVLSNPHERAFYDRHRENIIHGGDGPEDKKDMGINLAPYFERSCFQGFGEDEKGFYHVYRDLFHKISAEEYLYIEEMDDRNFPVFGNSQSTYEMFVDPFYSFWMDFATHRSFAWLDTYNLREAQDRATLRAMEKENKKLRDAGKNQRSEEIQRLVMHIRKLDPRVKAYRKQLAERNKEQLKRVEEHRLQTIRRNLEDLEDYEEDEEAKLEHMRRLEEIENQLDAEFGTLGVKKPANAGSDDNLEENEDDEDDSYCVVCEKHFKTSKSYTNHIKSKKHRQGVELLRKHMREEDQAILLELEREQEKVEDENGTKRQTKKKGKCQEEKLVEELAEVDVDSRLREEISDLQDSISNTLFLSRENDTNKSENGEAASPIASDDLKDKGKTKKKARRAVTINSSKKPSKAELLKEENISKSTEPVRSSCETCGEEFESRSKLFNHLRDSGHAAIKSVNDSITKSAKKKGGKKLK